MKILRAFFEFEGIEGTLGCPISCSYTGDWKIEHIEFNIF